MIYDRTPFSKRHNQHLIRSKSLDDKFHDHVGVLVDEVDALLRDGVREIGTKFVLEQDTNIYSYSRTQPTLQINKLGRICSNSFEFRNFEFQTLNSNSEFGRI